MLLEDEQVTNLSKERLQIPEEVEDAQRAVNFGGVSNHLVERHSPGMGLLQNTTGHFNKITIYDNSHHHVFIYSIGVLCRIFHLYNLRWWFELWWQETGQNARETHYLQVAG